MKYIVLLSAGLDSSVNLLEAHREGSVLLALTFDYGQRAAKSEIRSAQNLCAELGLRHQVIELPFIKSFGKSSLIDSTKNIPTQGQVSIDDLKVSQKTAESVWVPNRNGILLNIAAGFAEALGADAIVPGFNIEEAQTFPDNSTDYLKALDQSFSFSTANKVVTRCFTDQLNKTQIVKRGIELGLDFNHIWPCYFSAENWCGVCESCQRSLRAMKANGVNR